MCRSEIETGTDFENCFQRTFLSQMRAAERCRRVQERIQQRNEPTVAHSHAKSRLCTEANMDFCDTREQIVGLRSRQLCMMLMGSSHDYFDDLLHDIVEFECVETERQRNYGGRADQGGTSPSQSGKTFEKRNPEDRAMPSARKNGRPPQKKEQEEPKCYNCMKFSDIA